MSKVYIAYGSNLNMEQMKNRCPTAKFVGTGVVENHELQFKGAERGAHATIAPKPGSSVPVGIWQIQRKDEMWLDQYEGYPRYYFKQNMDVKVGNATVRGMVYIMNLKMEFGVPSQHYYETIERGYQDCGLNTNVLEQALIDSAQKAEVARIQQNDMQIR